jgi:regulator of replication initiation timing
MAARDLPPITLEVFELVGSYIVDTICNYHYEIAAQQHRDGHDRRGERVHTVTEAYGNILRSYAFKVTKNRDVYQNFVSQLRNSFNKYSKFEYTFAKFEERILSQFIPPEYLAQFNNAEREKTLCKILTTAVGEICAFAQRREMLVNIIDKRTGVDSHTTVRLLQDFVNESFSRQREEFYAKFAAQIVKRASGGGVDHEIYGKLLNEFRAEKKKRIELDTQVEKLTKMVKILNTENEQYRRENEQIRAEIGAKSAQPSATDRSSRTESSPHERSRPFEVVVDNGDDSDDAESTPTADNPTADDDTTGSFWT